MKFDKNTLLLYAVTDRSWLGEGSLSEQVEKVLKSGATFIQLREKNLKPEVFLQEARELKEICKKHRVPFVINDDVDIALAVDADGVHVGQEDMEAGKVRLRMGPEKIVGVSAQTVEQALKAEAAGADYLGVGAVFPTGSKADAEVVDRELLREICSAVKIPVIAIGGIGTHNVMKLSNTGVQGVAVISALFAADDTEEATRTLRKRTVEMLMYPEYEGIIMDMDGVLLDSMPYWETAAGRYLKTLGIEPDQDLERQMFTMTMEEGAQYLKDRYSMGQPVEEIREGVNRAITESYETSIPLKPGVRDFLERKRARGIPMTVATSTDEGPAKAALERLEIMPFFSRIFTASGVGEGKQSPRIYLEAAKSMNLKAEEIMVFEDAFHAAATAKKAGFLVTGVGDVFSQEREKELRELSHGFIDSFEEI